MRVLMFGWEFPPHIAGGLGTACKGIVEGLAHNGVETLFVMPSASGDEDQSCTRIINASDVAVAQYVIGGTSDLISTLINNLSDIFGGKGTITVNGTDNPSDVDVYSIDGSQINVDEDRATTVKGSGDTPDRVVVKVDDPGIYAVKSPKASKLVLVF